MLPLRHFSRSFFLKTTTKSVSCLNVAINSNGLSFQPQQKMSPEEEKRRFSSFTSTNWDWEPAAGREERWFMARFALDPAAEQQLKIELHKGIRGRKYFCIYKWCKQSNRTAKFANINVPEDAYPFVGALDQLGEELLTTNCQQRLQAAEDKPSNEGNHVVLAGNHVKGVFYDYQLDVFLFDGPNSFLCGSKICFQMQTIESVQPHKGKWLVLPFRALPWLRNEMAGMLAQHDGSQQLGPAPQIPKWLLEA